MIRTINYVVYILDMRRIYKEGTKESKKKK